jgi:hypothetical protein
MALKYSQHLNIIVEHLKQNMFRLNSSNYFQTYFLFTLIVLKFFLIS